MAPRADSAAEEVLVEADGTWVRMRDGTMAEVKAVVAYAGKEGGRRVEPVRLGCVGEASKDSIMYTDGLASCDGLVDWGHKHHCRMSHGENKFVERENPGNRINGIESFWGYAKNRPVKYQGIPKEDSYLHLKECEFRFNMRGRDMYRFMLRELRERPLN